MDTKTVSIAISIAALSIALASCGDSDDGLANAACENMILCSGIDEHPAFDRDAYCFAYNLMEDNLHGNVSKECSDAVEAFLKCVGEAECSDLDTVCEAAEERAEERCER